MRLMFVLATGLIRLQGYPEEASLSLTVPDQGHERGYPHHHAQLGQLKYIAL